MSAFDWFGIIVAGVVVTSGYFAFFRRLQKGDRPGRGGVEGRQQLLLVPFIVLCPVAVLVVAGTTHSAGWAGLTCAATLGLVALVGRMLVRRNVASAR